MSHYKIIKKIELFDVPFEVHEHEPIRTVQDAIDKWPFGIEELVKTIAFRLKDGRLVLAAVLAADRIDYKKLATFFEVSRRSLQSLSPEEVFAELGLEPGAVGPIVPRNDIIVLIDEKVMALSRLFCGCGQLNLTLQMNPKDVLQVCGGEVATISK